MKLCIIMMAAGLMGGRLEAREMNGHAKETVIVRLLDAEGNVGKPTPVKRVVK